MPINQYIIFQKLSHHSTFSRIFARLKSLLFRFPFAIILSVPLNKGVEFFANSYKSIE